VSASRCKTTDIYIEGDESPGKPQPAEAINGDCHNQITLHEASHKRDFDGVVTRNGGGKRAGNIHSPKQSKMCQSVVERESWRVS
jgi:hypothetical protein